MEFHTEGGADGFSLGLKAYGHKTPFRVWGEPDEATMAQLVRCSPPGLTVRAALMADAHKGYSMPIGGVVAYDGYVSPSGVGYDIACGIKAVKTDLYAPDIIFSMGKILDDVARSISFGLGRSNPDPAEHALFDDEAWLDIKPLASLKEKAHHQLGTVGSGNHFVDLLKDESGNVWVAAHFGSRGFGHGVATGFLNLAHGQEFYSKPKAESMEDPPTLIKVDTPTGEDYMRAMELAGRYAYAGRDYVVDTVLGILGAKAQETVHNHHNFAWVEEHDGVKCVAVRKGATPARPGQQGFVGGSMADIAAIVEGVESPENTEALQSTVHGAGRIMSRTAARGKMKKGIVKRQGQVTRQMMSEACKEAGVVVRGGDVDESPHVYRKLQAVLDAHAGSIRVLHTLKPLGVVMAGAEVKDPYKD